MDFSAGVHDVICTRKINIDFYTFQKCTVWTNEKSSIFRLYNNIQLWTFQLVFMM